jgi:anti-sigma-K factor RskA
MEPQGHGDAAAYALGALEPAEAEAFRRHLETCAACREELSALAATADVLPMAAPQYPLPPEVRHRVLEQVRAEPRTAGAGIAATARPGRSRWVGRPALVGVALASIVALAVVGAVLLSGAGNGTRVITATVGHAKLYVTDGRGQLVVSRLAPARSGHTYQAWLLAAHRSPRPAGLFSVTRTGRARVDLRGDLRGVSAVAVTEEPAGGTQRPTTTPIIVAPL